jgi:hypothetical protein
VVRSGVAVEGGRGGWGLLAAESDGEADEGDDELRHVDQQLGAGGAAADGAARAGVAADANGRGSGRGDVGRC